MRTTTIEVLGEPWDVPRGFGAEYSRQVKEDLALAGKGKPGEVIGRIRDCLELIGYTASTETIADWPLRKRVEAVVYALNVHLRASDNPIPRHPRPDWFPAEPWQGPGAYGASIFDGPRPTVIKGSADG